jgi:hypothetical protein
MKRFKAFSFPSSEIDTWIVFATRKAKKDEEIIKFLVPDMGGLFKSVDTF